MDQERRRSPVSARIVHAAIAFTPGTMTSLLGIGRIIARLSAYRNASWGKEHNSEEHDYFPELEPLSTSHGATSPVFEDRPPSDRLPFSAAIVTFFPIRLECSPYLAFHL